MKYPFIRVLAALLVGVWAPMCCCQSAWLLGVDCGRAEGHAVLIAACSPAAASSGCGCCRHDRTDCPDGEEQSNEPLDGRAPSAPCNSCPSCHGSLLGDGLVGQESSKIGQPLMDAIAAMLIGDPIGQRVPATRCQLRCDRAFAGAARGGRELLRWQCALIV